MFGIAMLSGFDIIKNKDFIQKEPYFKSHSFKGDLLEYFQSVQILTTELKEDLQKVGDKNDTSKIDLYYEKIKAQVDSKQSLRYYIKNKKSGEIYTNIKNLNNVEDYINNNAIYVEKFPKDSNNTGELQSINNWFQRNNFEGSFIFIKTTEVYSQMQKNYIYYNSIRERVIKEVILGSISLVIAICLLVFLRLNSRVESNYVKVKQKYEKIPLDLRAVIFLVCGFVMSIYLKNVSFFYKPINIRQFIILTIVSIYCLYFMFNVYFALRLLIHKEELSEELGRSIAGQIILLTHEGIAIKVALIKEISLFVATALFGMFFILGIIGVVTDNKLALFFSFVYGMIYFMVVPLHTLKKVSALNKIIEGTDAIVSGDLDYVIEETGDSNFIKISQNINNMKESFKKSVESQIKSERFKTELITNVSHDLKTPLTSIINYVSLLKKDNISKEDSKKYIDILDQKSQRLKVLIEDLFEASKISSGAVELNIEKVDIASLLRQALGEFDHKITSSSLIFKINIPVEEVHLNLDGKRTWRVFENLIGNALKYSQPNSRVYIDLIEQDEKVIITIKNMSSYEMNFDVSEIFERFKRGDKARSTEGSGLGLSIAKSIVELQGGHMRIDIDGDLFKVTVEFSK
ncbi:sensor histidine kinase [Clostridium lundense]|uniref:sensor histidine kinase n=1 Tax=Clostridium lundense TaxID=319475 RepID=UPI0004824A82|nr:sensor histidine kinase [Clostridium lundense]